VFLRQRKGDFYVYYNVMRNNRKLYLFFFFLLCLFFQAKAQNVVNFAHNIIINPGAYLIISGDYHNVSSGANASVDLDGTIKIFGNWYNQVSGIPGNNVFVNIEPNPQGLVHFTGTNTQLISGNTPTHFENILITGGKKMLEATHSKVFGKLTVNAILDLNTRRFIIDNPSPEAITYISRYILSETTPMEGYGEIQWNIGSSTNEYKIPFGSGYAPGNDLNLRFTSKTQGSPDNAYMVFATYPTDCYNQPLPLGIMALDRDEQEVADRFWIINANAYNNKPNVDIVFKYTNYDIRPACNTNLKPASLKAHRFNTTQQTWDDFEPDGVSDRPSQTVGIFDVSGSDLFHPWCLVSDDNLINFFIPNAFTPDGDGKNDYFMPVGFDADKYTYDMYIFNRWGEEIYQTTPGKGYWDGTDKQGRPVEQEGVYVWLIIFADKFGNVQTMHGHVTLLLTREK